MNELSLPFPEGPPTEEAHFHIVTDCTKPASHLYQGTVDNAIVHLFFATKRNTHRGRGLIPAKCPELFDIVSLIPFSHSRFYSQINDECTNGTTSRACWQESSDRNRLKWLSHLFDDQWRPLREVVCSPLFDRTTLRYLAFLTSNRVRLAGVQFSGESRLQAGILSTRPILKDTYLWELNGLLSLDTVTDSTISTIMPHQSQGLDLVPRLMTGPARFVNHCCRPNAELFPLPSRPVFVIRTVEDIDAHSEITVDYGPTFWETGACLCHVCSPTPPIFSTSLLEEDAGCSVTMDSAPAAPTTFAYHSSVVEPHTEVNMTEEDASCSVPMESAPAAPTTFAHHFSVVETHTEVNMTEEDAGCSGTLESAPAAPTTISHHFSVVETHTEVNMTEEDAGRSVTMESAPAAPTTFAYHFSVVETHTEVNMTKKKRKVKAPLDEESLYTQFFRIIGTRFSQGTITGIRRSIIPAGRYGMFVYHVRLDSDVQSLYRSNPTRSVTQSIKPTEKFWYTIAREGTTSSCGWDAFPIDPVHQNAINAMRSFTKRGPIRWPRASEIVETPVPSEKDDDDDDDGDEFFTPPTTILELE